MTSKYFTDINFNNDNFKYWLISYKSYCLSVHKIYFITEWYLLNVTDKQKDIIFNEFGKTLVPDIYPLIKYITNLNELPNENIVTPEIGTFFTNNDKFDILNINNYSDFLAYTPPQNNNNKGKCNFVVIKKEILNMIPYDVIEELFLNKIPDTAYSGQPLISCIMVTKNRLEKVKKAVDCFINQTYKNKELIIIEDGDDDTFKYITKLAHPNIRIYHLTSSNLTLGELRNMSIEKSMGEYLIQWDDDDYYHPTRIAIMYKKLKEKNVDVLYLSKWMMAWPQKGYYTISNYRGSGWEGSMLIKTEKMLKYPLLRRGEDTVLQEEIKSNGTKWATLDNYEILYLYVIHNNNTWNSYHFSKLFIGNKCLPYDENLLRNMLKLSGTNYLRGKLTDQFFDLDNNDILLTIEQPQQINGMAILITFIILIIIFIIFLILLYMKPLRV